MLCTDFTTYLARYACSAYGYPLISLLRRQLPPEGGSLTKTFRFPLPHFAPFDKGGKKTERRGRRSLQGNLRTQNQRHPERSEGSPEWLMRSRYCVPFNGGIPRRLGMTVKSSGFLAGSE